MQILKLMFRNKSVICLAVVVLLGQILTHSIFAEEKIYSYDSNIRVHENGSMTVVETIVVKAEGKSIRRGIYRDFPTKYKDHIGNSYNTTFRILSVKRDGNSEPYHQERLSNGIRLYIGSKSVFLTPATYTYQIEYLTDYQLGFFERHDELYWNVTGNGWSFPIDEVSVNVILPEMVQKEDVHLEAYTGYSGAKGGDYQAKVSNDGSGNFHSTRTLQPNEGITIVMTWPKGVVAEPTKADKRKRFMQNNQQYVIAGLGLLGLLGYFLLVWFKFGRDPGPGVIYPRYSPPKGYGPDELRYIKRMGYDNKTFTSAIVDLAARGFLKIKEDKKLFSKDYELSVDNKLAPLTDKDRAITHKLFSGGYGSLELDDKNHEKIRSAINKHKKHLSKSFKNRYFFTNTPFFLIGVALAVFLVFITMNATVSRGGHVLIMLITVIAALGICALFHHLLKAPTLASRKLLDEIDGFIEYMKVAEGEELKAAESPELTSELYEKYLPYALALDVEQPWSKKFDRVFAELARENADYQPSWYSGRSFNSHSMNSFSSSLASSFNSAISSSSTPPGSSSGSGGGGFSGGGGGGGGGGGW